jgi:hypothetical protein
MQTYDTQNGIGALTALVMIVAALITLATCDTDIAEAVKPPPPRIADGMGCATVQSHFFRNICYEQNPKQRPPRVK